MPDEEREKLEEKSEELSEALNDDAKAEDMDRLSETIDEEDIGAGPGNVPPKSHMRVVTPGYKYDLLAHEGPQRNKPQNLLFVRYRPINDGEDLELVHNGTTNEALLEVLEHRIEQQQKIVSDDYSEAVLKAIRMARQLLDIRTKERESRGVEGTHKE